MNKSRNGAQRNDGHNLMTIDLQTKKNLQRRRLKGYACCAVFCGIPLFVFVFMLSSFVWYVGFYHEFGENQPRAPVFNAEGGTNFSFNVRYAGSLVEFTISEQEFLDWCKKSLWNPVEIKDLPSLPRVEFDWDNDAAWPRINEQQGSEIPLLIARYNWWKPEHENCSPVRYVESDVLRCQIDPTGKTGDSCFRFVADGFYYETRRRSQGGFIILFDRESNRVYVQENAR